MRILTLADLHMGSIKDIVYVYNVLTDIIEREVVFTKTDMVVILGDYFDKLFYNNSPYTGLSINFMSYLVRACKKTKTKIRLIYGTESHEQHSYGLFNHHFTDPKIDIRLIETVEIETIGDVSILYVPEEYVDDKREYYHDTLYSGNQYDYIFGHGNISEGMPMLLFDKSSKSNEKKVPTFQLNDLAGVSKVCVFGHYHNHKDMGNDCFYQGSVFRYSFGEEDPKGYGVIEEGKYRFVENAQAYVYKTYEYDEDSEIYTLENLTKEANRIKEENSDIFDGSKVGYIRLLFRAPPTIDSTFKENVRSLLSNDKQFSLQLKEPDIKAMILQEETPEVKEYDFILDNSLAVHDKLHQYINKTYTDCPFTIEDVKEIIYEDLKV